MPRVCLAMIVKDEAHVLPRCLGALAPHVHCATILDTGSTDRTPELLRELFAQHGLDGRVHRDEFRGMAASRNQALELARADHGAGFLLMIDADDTWSAPPGWTWPNLPADGYNVRLSMGGASWYRMQLTRSTVPWRYEGAAHEYLIAPPGARSGRLDGPVIQCGNDGARRRNEGPAKYLRIARVIEGELERNPNHPRSVYYLAQSYKDAGETARALQLYEQRAELSGWAEERWHAMYQVGCLKQRLGYPFEEVEQAFLRAYEFRPSRNEPLVELAIICRTSGRRPRAFVYASSAMAIPRPQNELLFVTDGFYDWRAQDEFAVVAYHLGHLESAAKVNQVLLASGKVPDSQRPRIEQNLRCCLPKPAAEPQTIIRCADVPDGARITVAMATHNPDPVRLRRAVQSILDQTYPNWRLVIVVDGGEEPRWGDLPECDDPRVTTFYSPINGGQFFALELARRASDDPLFAVMDDDDSSARDRLAYHTAALIEEQADVLFGPIATIDPDTGHVTGERRPNPALLEHDRIAHVGPHVGLWKREALEQVGGYYGGMRLGYDTMLVWLVAKYGRPCFVERSVYQHYLTAGSLTRSSETGFGSDARRREAADIRVAWEQIRVAQEPLTLASHLARAREPELYAELDKLADQLRARLRGESVAA